MVHLFGRYVLKEMALLWLVECGLVFVIFYALVSSATQLDPSLALTSGRAVNLAAMLAGTIGVSAVVIGLYRFDACLQRRRLLRDLVLAVALAFPALIVVSQIYDIHLSENYLLWLLKGLLAWVLCIAATRWIFSLTMRQSAFVRRVWVLGSGDRAVQTCNVIQARPNGLFEVVPAGEAAAFVDSAPQRHEREAGETQAEIRPWSAPSASKVLAENLRAKGVWGIVVAGNVPTCRRTVERDGDTVGRNHSHNDAGLAPEMLLELKLRGIRVFNDVGFWEQHLGRINLDRIDTSWLMFADGFASSALDRAVKRVSDILFSLTLLLITLPLMLVTALLIKFESHGPVFYRQVRVGLHGNHFTLLKFRSMAVDAESGGKPRWASKRDPRVTRIGGFIRSTRIDELPQLMNVVRGEMSFIGPRPERPHFVEQLAHVIPFYQERSYVKPGITGWAQVNFPYGASVEDAREKLSYDLYYVKNRSLLLDIVILFSTVRVILFQVGAR
jgi:exopolysaccharide biosynthesis polyprenyl glycosylphosphotransferase